MLLGEGCPVLIKTRGKTLFSKEDICEGVMKVLLVRI